MSKITGAQQQSLSELANALSDNRVGLGTEIRAKGKDEVTLYAKTKARDIFTSKSGRMERQSAARQLISKSIDAEFGNRADGQFLAAVVKHKMKDFFQGQGKVTHGDLDNIHKFAEGLQSDYRAFKAGMRDSAKSADYLSGKADYKNIVQTIEGFKPDQMSYDGIAQYAKLANGPKPLSADTLKQMGALDAWFQEKRCDEKDVSGLRHATQALNIASEHGADSAKMLPQAVVLRQIGGAADQDGRCLPMVALAALAESQGANGMNHLLERFEQEVGLMYQQGKREQTPYMGHLAGIHGSGPLTESHTDIQNPEKTGRDWGHRDAIKHLANNGKTKSGEPVFYGMEVRGHIMMMGATKHDGKESFMFYDPNFGVARFSTADQLSSYMDDYFGDLGYAEEYGMAKRSDGYEVFLSQYDVSKLAKIPLDKLPIDDPQHVTMASLTVPRG